MEIKITKSAPICAISERPFIHDEEYISVLRVVEGELVRKDYAKECWNEALRDGAYSVWSPKYYDPKVAEQEPAEVFSPLRQVFYEAVASESRTELATAFLAAQLLRRQKVFKLIKESDEPDGEAHLSLYADRIGNRLIEVRDPSFSYAELELGRQQLLARLRALENPEEAETVPADAVSVTSAEASAAPEDNNANVEPAQDTVAP